MIYKTCKNISSDLKAKILLLKQYLEAQGNKVFILILMYLFVILTAMFVCSFSIIYSDNALFTRGTSLLILTAQSEARREEQILLTVEKSVEDLSNYLKITFDINKFDDLNYVKSYRNKFMYPAVKQLYQTTKDIQGMYAYLDVMRINPSRYVAEAWQSKEFVQIKYFSWIYTEKDPTMTWYYDMIKTQKPGWIEPYWDNDMEKVVISYTKPVYKDDNNKQNTFIAGIGVDMTSDELIRNVSTIKLYKTGYAFLVSRDYYFIASKDYSIRDNLFKVNNGYYLPLLKEMKKKHSSMVKIDKNLIAFSRLYNGYYLFIVVPKDEVMLPIRNLNLSLITFALFSVLTVTCLMVVLLKQLNNMMNSLETSDSIIMTIANSVEIKDIYTKGHIQRVTSYAEKMGHYFKLSAENIDTLKKASMLHDIGKIGIPDEILNKQGRLTEEELEIIKEHSIYGANILEPLSSHTELINLVRHHHEKLDGSGYPDGLKADKINLLTRILTMIDIYDNLVTERPYKKAISSNDALMILDIEVEKGHLDKQVLEGLKFILKNT